MVTKRFDLSKQKKHITAFTFDKKENHGQNESQSSEESFSHDYTELDFPEQGLIWHFVCSFSSFTRSMHLIQLDVIRFAYQRNH